MVVFIDGQPRPQEYRRFRIKTVTGANDFASMAEVLGGASKRAARDGRRRRERGERRTAPDDHDTRPRASVREQS